MNSEYSSATFQAAFTIQQRVVGALIMRELHTRFGRHNIGFLWIMVEPMILAIGVTTAHLFGFVVPMPYGIDTAPFWITGYTPWVMFRSIVMRGGVAIESNRTLLYHRIVTVWDIHLARALLDGAAVTFSLAFLLLLCVCLNLGHIPAHPLKMLGGMALLWWLGMGIALLYSAWAERTHVAEKVMEPAMYLMLPVSGVFFLSNWLPESFNRIVMWVPMPNIIEMIREGEFAGLRNPDSSIPYAIGWCMGLTLLGLFAIRIVRRKIELT